jgi:alpha-beta hydrolase superfamily lysophospholipase
MEIDERRFTLLAYDTTEISCFRWEGEAALPKAVIQIAHGAGEHSLRYLEPLTPLLEAGYIIYSADHRGHGLTAQRPGASLGDFGAGGAADAINDMATLSTVIREDEAGLPLILFGHSMGAMFAQAYLLEHSDLIDMLVLSGTAGGPNDPDAPPPRPAPRDGFEKRTDYDWLSRDPAEVDKYIADPLCGIRFTPESGASLGRLRERIGNPDLLGEVRSNLPVYVFVGDKDPINADLTRIHPLIQMYEDAGLTDVTLKVYPGGRHEMLNETNRAEVVADLKTWLDDRVLRLDL